MSGNIMRKIAGFAAVAILITIGARLPSWDKQHYPAEVRASREFSISSIEPGRYLWSLRDGSAPLGDGLLEERMLVFDRSDLVEIRIEAGVTTGATINEGHRVAVLRSTKTSQGLEELNATRRSLSAEKSLVLAGGPSEAINAAEERVLAAEANREAESARLERIRILAENGLVSEIELEVAEKEDRASRAEIDVAKAEVIVASAPARPEALARLDAELDRVNASITELESLRDEASIISPIRGVVEIGGPRAELSIKDIETVFLRIAVPEAQRAAFEVGDVLKFRTPAIPKHSFDAQLAAIADTSTMVDGIQFFWMTAAVDNGDHLLRSGVTGAVDAERKREFSWPWTAHE